jgi:hypothetical protein
LDWIKESVFLDFSGLANGVNRLSSIERSNETFWDFSVLGGHFWMADRDSAGCGCGNFSLD